ncbi:MAG: hypothetical protein IIW47_00070 [Bacteroidales bacterium]|nr:hypothetical protein [Bacteroidales bacterium]
MTKPTTAAGRTTATESIKIGHSTSVPQFCYAKTVAHKNTLQSIVINLTCTTRKKTQRVAQSVYAVGKYKAHLVRHCLAWMYN